LHRTRKIYDYTIKNEHVSNEYEHIITIVTEIKKGVTKRKTIHGFRGTPANMACAVCVWNNWHENLKAKKTISNDIIQIIFTYWVIIKDHTSSFMMPLLILPTAEHTLIQLFCEC